MHWRSVADAARTYVFTTAPPPLLSAALRVALQLIAAEDWRRERIRALVATLRAGLAGTRYRLLPSDTAIQPIIVGGNEAALALSRALFERGIWVPAIRPPTVPAGTARLRVSLSAAHDIDDVQRLVNALRELEHDAA